MQQNILAFIDKMKQRSKKILIVTLDFWCCVLMFQFCLAAVGESSDLDRMDLAFAFASLHLILSFTFQNYQIIWDLFGYRDVQGIVVSTMLAVVVVSIVMQFAFGIYFYSLLFVLSSCIIIVSRVVSSNWRSLFRAQSKGESCLIIGAGEAGAQLFLQLKSSSVLKLNPIGFLDDSLLAQNRNIHGSPILGTVKDIRRVKERFGVNKALVAIPSAKDGELRVIFRTILDAGVEVKTLPTLRDMLNGKVNPFQIKEIEPQELLGRDSVDLDRKFLKENFHSKTIIITGAGGSIGSELCRQIAHFSPKTLILFEQTELFLYELEMNLKEQFPHLNVIAKVGDVRDYQVLEKVVFDFKPDIFFHAAAYKHVPLMEQNPVQAVMANVIGSSNAALISGELKIPRFVLVSTDKAVNPTNVMGATKRAAEISCQVCSEDYPDTKFMVVRFGNVLGSSGSVIPLFKRQILAGGPLTVTDRNVVRYFMSIPEACQLVMQASTIGRGGELFVLDMGDPVKIVDLASDMIRLSGLEPGVDIKIIYTGLRPGEKLFEELLCDKEKTITSSHSKIRIANSRKTDLGIRKCLAELKSIDKNADALSVITLLQKLVPEFTHK